VPGDGFNSSSVNFATCGIRNNTSLAVNPSDLSHKISKMLLNSSPALFMVIFDIWDSGCRIMLACANPEDQVG